MGTIPLIIGCLLSAIALHSASAADENNTIQFSNSESIPQVSVSQRFEIPEVTRDVRYDQYISEWVAENVMRFAHDLGVALDDNVYPNTQIFSPLSVMSALSILQMGANGRSYQQLSKLFTMLVGSTERSWKIHEEFGWLLEDLMANTKNLKRPHEEAAWRKTPANPNAFSKGGKNTPSEHTIRVANGLFVQQGFSLRPDYKYAAQSVYKSEVTPLDFRHQKDQAKHHINSWVNQNTLGKIPAIIADEVNSDTNMILASALYFKGFWEQPFLGSGTGETNFYPDGKSNKPVRVMMMGTGGVFPYYDSPEYNCHIIGLPYKGNQTTMYIIQPHDSTRRNLYDLQNFLTGDRINDLISKMEQKTAVLAFPKFHVTNTLHLKTPLIKMGIEDIFINGLSDFSLIADEGQYLEQAGIPPPTPTWSVPQGESSPSEIINRQQTPTFQSRPAVAPPLVRPLPETVQRLPESILSQETQTFQPRPQSTAASRPLPEGVYRLPETTVSQQAPTFQPADSNDRQLVQRIEPEILDRYNEAPLVFVNRFGGSDNVTSVTGRQAQRSQMRYNQQDDFVTDGVLRTRSKRTVTYKVESEFMRSNLPLRLKDLILNKRITKPNPGKKISRNRRQALPDSAASLQNLDLLRTTGGLRKPQLYVDDILHKVDFDVNEQGTEAAAATLTYLRRSGTDVAFRCDSPFMLLIRHDPTKLPLFYGKVNIPLA